MNDEIICVASFTAKEGKANALRQALSNLVEPTRSEEGCLLYTLNEGIDNPNVLTMLERFKNKAAFDFHSNQPYVVNFRQLLTELVEVNSSSVIVYKELI